MLSTYHHFDKYADRVAGRGTRSFGLVLVTIGGEFPQRPLVRRSYILSTSTVFARLDHLLQLHQEVFGLPKRLDHLLIFDLHLFDLRLQRPGARLELRQLLRKDHIAGFEIRQRLGCRLGVRDDGHANLVARHATCDANFRLRLNQGRVEGLELGYGVLFALMLGENGELTGSSA